VSLPSLLLSNVRSLANKLDEIEVRAVSLNPDLIVLTETWLDSDTPDESVTLSGYAVARKDRNKFGGGIIIYVSLKFCFDVIDSNTVPSISACDTEILPVYFTSLKLLIVCIYHPFWKDAIKNEIAISCITDIIDHVFCVSESNPSTIKIVICGDFNDLVTDIDVLENSFDLKRIVTKVTRGSRVLDQIVTNIKSDNAPNVSAPFGCSDHAVVTWYPQLPAAPVIVKKRIRNFSQKNRRSFETAMSLVNWQLIDDFSDIDFAVVTLHNVLSFLFDSCFPYVTVRFRSTDPAWMNGTLKVLMDKRDRAFHNKNFVKYRYLRLKVVKYIHVLKRNYLLKSASSNGCDAWNRIRTVSRVKRCPTPNNLSATELNEYFSSVFQRCDFQSVFSDNNCGDFSSLPDFPLVVNESQVEFFLRHLKKGGGGHDGLPLWLFKNNSIFLSRILANIFNKCFDKGHFPAFFKFANIVPVPKCKKPVASTDFRPISVLPVLSKVMEKIVVSCWILPHVASKLSTSQFAYIPGSGKGTTTALTLINHHILKFLDVKSGAVRLLAADFSKAFDRLPFETIFSSIVKFKLPRQAVLFLYDFLFYRYQRVVTSNETSDWSLISSGVPQGSIIGPILFSLVIDSLSPVCNNSLCFKYADDVTFLHFIRSEEEDFLQHEWSHLEAWSRSVGLTLNHSKSFVMNYVTKKSLNLQDVMTDAGAPISTVTSISLLGVTLSCDFSWNIHIDNIVKKCYRRFFILRNMRRSSCPSSVIFKCYVAFIRSVLLYSFPCFCNLPSYLLDKLLRVERLATKYFPNFTFYDLLTVTDTICKKLFLKIVKCDSHPLRVLFRPRVITPRNDCPLTAVFAKTTRLSKSFIRFGRM